MASHRPLRTRIAQAIAAASSVRGDAPVILVPGRVGDVDMADAVRTMAEGMGHDTLTMRTAFVRPWSGCLSKPATSGLAASERDRLHVLDDRDEPPADIEQPAQWMVPAVIDGISKAGGVRAPIVVVSRLGADGLEEQAALLRDVAGFGGVVVVA